MAMYTVIKREQEKSVTRDYNTTNKFSNKLNTEAIRNERSTQVWINNQLTLMQGALAEQRAKCHEEYKAKQAHILEQTGTISTEETTNATRELGFRNENRQPHELFTGVMRSQVKVCSNSSLTITKIRRITHKTFSICKIKLEVRNIDGKRCRRSTVGQIASPNW